MKVSEIVHAVSGRRVDTAQTGPFSRSPQRVGVGRSEESLVGRNPSGGTAHPPQAGHPLTCDMAA